MNLTIMEAKEMAFLKATVKHAIEALEVCDFCDAVTDSWKTGLGGAYLCSGCAKAVRFARGVLGPSSIALGTETLLAVPELDQCPVQRKRSADR